MSKRDGDGRTLLHYAAREGHLEVVKYLINKGSNINEKDNYGGRIPLHYAAMNEHLEVVKYLINKGANIDEKDNRGVTALHQAIYWGRLNVVKFLVRNGANIHERNNEGKSPLEETAYAGDTEGVRNYLSRLPQLETAVDSTCISRMICNDRSILNRLLGIQSEEAVRVFELLPHSLICYIVALANGEYIIPFNNDKERSRIERAKTLLMQLSST